MSSIPSKTYDLVIYGATGFTGQYVVEEVARVAQAEAAKADGAKQSPLKWAVAGRNKSKLLTALEEARKQTGLPLDGVGVLEADVGDIASVDRMTAQARVVINCVGPYIKYGEPVVKSCIANHADHVDISGEPEFLEGMQLRHDAAAEAAAVHIVGACGFDSIPAELGVNLLQEQFPGGLNSVEMYNRFRSTAGAAPIHTGTMESAALAVSRRHEVAAQHRQLFPERLPRPKFPPPKRGIIHHNSALGLYAVPMPSDEPVVYRSQRYHYDTQQIRPVIFKQYLGFGSWLAAFGTAVGGAYFIMLSLFSWTRNLLIKYPEVMTAGTFSRAGASRESLKGLSFSSTLVGHGWTKALAEPTDEHTNPPDHTVTVIVRGPDPGYGATSLMLVASAMTLLREKSSCARSGGVVTPGVAFQRTAMLQRLRDRGMKFDLD